MTFVVSAGQLTGLNRTSAPRASGVALSTDYTADYATIWRTQPQVRTVIGFLARNIAQIGLHSFARISDTDRKRLAASEHPLAQLFAKPNPRTTQFRLFEALVSDLGIFDVACWAKIKVEDVAAPAGILRLPPQQLEPLGESWAWPDGVRFKGSKGELDLTAEQIVLFHGYNPTDARWGVSPMETLRRVLAEEFEAARYREQLWRNGARVPGVITRPKDAGAWSRKARERFRADWRGLYTGNGPAAGGTPVLEDGMEFVPGGITPVDAQYLESRKLTREEVAAAFHIPPPMVGILDHATFSNIEEQHRNLYQDTLGPWLEMIEQEIELQLVPDFDDTGKVYVEFNLAEKMKGSFEEQAKSLQTAVGGPWMLRSEARSRMNLPHVDGMDEPITPLNVLIGGQASPSDADSTKSHPLADVLSAFFARQGKAIKSRLGDQAGAWDPDRWQRELLTDLAAATAPQAYDPEGVL